MEKLIKIAEINAETPESAELIAGTLEEQGFTIVCSETEGYCGTMMVLLKKTNQI